MKTYDIGDFTTWERLTAGEAIAFFAPAGTRKVRLRVNTDSPLEVLVGAPGDESPVLVAADQGLFGIAISITDEAHVLFHSANEDAVIFVDGIARTQVVKRKEEDAYTGIMPQGRRNSDLDRMMMVMRANERRRERQLADEIRALKEAAKPPAPLVEKDDETKLEPKKAKAKPAQKEDDDEKSEADDTEVGAETAET